MLLAAGAGAFAYLNDARSPPGDQMIAGTLDLKTNNADGVSRTLYALSMSPGDSAASEPVMLKNTGNVDGATLDIVFSYVKSDGSPNTIPKSADQTAAVLQVTSLAYGVTNLLAILVDTNGNGYIDVQDLKGAANITALTNLSGLAAGASKNFNISVRLWSGTGSEFQADGISLTITFFLNQ
jgi:hypothetical protein